MFEVSVEHTFAAGHALRHYKGKCENVHGHNYKVQVIVEGERLDSIGLLVDFLEIKKLLRAACERLDHQYLNDVAPFDVLNPSAENMAKYFYDRISSELNTDGGRVRLGQIKVWETDVTVATFRSPGN